VDQPEQDVLGTDVVVVEQARFFLRQDHNPACTVGESLEHGASRGLYREGRLWIVSVSVAEDSPRPVWILYLSAHLDPT